MYIDDPILMMPKYHTHVQIPHTYSAHMLVPHTYSALQHTNPPSLYSKKPFPIEIVNIHVCMYVFVCSGQAPQISHNSSLGNPYVSHTEYNILPYTLNTTYYHTH